MHIAFPFLQQDAGDLSVLQRYVSIAGITPTLCVRQFCQTWAKLWATRGADTACAITGARLVNGLSHRSLTESVWGQGNEKVMKYNWKSRKNFEWTPFAKPMSIEIAGTKWVRD